MGVVRGRCLCGDVAWRAEGDLELHHHCHCSYCRKSHGAAFATQVAASAERFAWTSGEEGIARYESTPGHWRPFCARCGSALPGDSVPDRVFMPSGSLDDDPGAPILAHIFAASKAEWYEIPDSLPRFDALPPGYEEGAEHPRPPREPAPEGGAAGSCLCGAVAYELDGPLELIVLCHCSRCRRATGAAHAANLFAPAAAFRWRRGEALVKRYRLPGAKRFDTRFCGTCGCPMPGVDPNRGLVVVPAGSLDGDPGARPRLHIFVGSMPSWFEIGDELPRFEENVPGS